MLGKIGTCSQKAHAKASCIVKTQFEIVAKLENQMVVYGVLLGPGTNPQTASHPQVQEQHAFWMQIDEEIFGASLHPLDGAADGVFLEGTGINEMPESWLPHSYTGDLSANQARGESTANGFYFW
jgi:hypothetical protein